MKRSVIALVLGSMTLSGCIEAAAPIAAGAVGRVAIANQREKADQVWLKRAEQMSCAELNAERKKYRNLNVGFGHGWGRELASEQLMNRKGCKFS